VILETTRDEVDEVFDTRIKTNIKQKLQLRRVRI
jgi:hypothetical protein